MSDQIMLHSQVYIPFDYNYALFGIGIGFIGLGIWRFCLVNTKHYILPKV